MQRGRNDGHCQQWKTHKMRFTEAEYFLPTDSGVFEYYWLISSSRTLRTALGYLCFAMTVNC